MELRLDYFIKGHCVMSKRPTNDPEFVRSIWTYLRRCFEPKFLSRIATSKFVIVFGVMLKRQKTLNIIESYPQKEKIYHFG